MSAPWLPRLSIGRIRIGGPKGASLLARLLKKMPLRGTRSGALTNSNSPSAERQAGNSRPLVFKGAPRFRAGSHGACALVRVVIQISYDPNPPARSIDVKINVSPSAEIDATPSSALLFTAVPRFTGGPNGSVELF